MVRTRFAPSPTGYLHIGGVRTALFCWLFSRRHGGQFILRIDDTDQQRNVEEALAPILHGLKWLGIDWDEGPQVGGPHEPYYQSQRLEHYKAAVQQLLDRGAAYYDYATPEEIQAERKAAEEAKQSFLYSRRWMAQTPEDRAGFEGQGRKPVVRLKMPRDGTLVIDDLIRGRVEFQWAREQDHVIQRTDGSCLYHLASVVDDYQFEITHVIRAEEHLSNTPRQIFILESLGYPRPQYAHLPFVAEPGSRNKLSKRKLDKYLKNKDFAELVQRGRGIMEALGEQPDPETFNPVIVDFYERLGFLPEAIINYLALLGWSLDETSEEFTREELIRVFSLEKVNKAPASFDPAKLMSFQDRYMRRVPIDEKVAAVLPYLEQAGLIGPPPDSSEKDKDPVGNALRGVPRADETRAALSAAERHAARSLQTKDAVPMVPQILAAAGDRIKIAGDILEYADFFLADDRLCYDEKAFDKSLRKPGAAELLARFRDRLAAAESFDAASLEALMHTFVAEHKTKIADIIHPVRVAVTGKSVGFGLFDTLAILGKQQSLSRIQRALEIAGGTKP
jgi:glutamyl-tRNA synthetase